jgi:hypothetical protein
VQSPPCSSRNGAQMPANSDNADDYPLTSPGIVPSPAIGYWLLAIGY